MSLVDEAVRCVFSINVPQKSKANNSGAPESLVMKAIYWYLTLMLLSCQRLNTVITFILLCARRTRHTPVANPIWKYAERRLQEKRKVPFTRLFINFTSCYPIGACDERTGIIPLSGAPEYNGRSLHFKVCFSPLPVGIRRFPCYDTVRSSCPMTYVIE